MGRVMAEKSMSKRVGEAIASAVETLDNAAQGVGNFGRGVVNLLTFNKADIAAAYVSSFVEGGTVEENILIEQQRTLDAINAGDGINAYHAGQVATFGVVLVSGAIGYADALIASEEVAAVAGTVVAGSIAANSRGDLGGLPSPKHHQAVPAAKGSATTI
jgi:hypothetical protein